MDGRAEPESPLLIVENLGKAFRVGRPWSSRTLSVLENVSFTVSRGEALALLGANGSGKTTLLKVLASLITPDSGSIEFAGRRLRSLEAVRHRIGFASGEERSYFFRLTARQNLEFFGALHGLGRGELRRRIEELSAELRLGPFLDRRVYLCSSGMRALLGLARALLHRPTLLLLDEPTKSLDSSNWGRARGIMRRWAAAGNAVVFSTHVAEEAEEVAGRIGILEGRRLTLHRVQSEWRRRLTSAA